MTAKIVLFVVYDSLGASSCSPTHQFLNWVSQVLLGYEEARRERGGESSGVWTTARTAWRDPHAASSKFRTISLWLAKRTGMFQHMSKQPPYAQHGAEQAIPSHSWTHENHLYLSRDSGQGLCLATFQIPPEREVNSYKAGKSTYHSVCSLLRH